MHTTKAFKNGDLQAVEIPAELAFARTDIELEIERVGEELRIRPAKKSLAGVLKNSLVSRLTSWRRGARRRSNKSVKILNWSPTAFSGRGEPR
jgi:virulence-associated protein VagC